MFEALGALLNASAKAHYEHLFEVTKQEVNRWDPLDLIAAGAPCDEYEQEVTLLVPKLPSASSESEFREVIAAIFAEAFGETGITPQSCSGFASRLHSRFLEEGLV